MAQLSNHLKCHLPLHEALERETVTNDILKKQPGKSSETKNSRRQPRLSECIPPKLKQADSRANGVMKEIGLFVLCDLHGYNTVKNNWLHDITVYILPSYQGPSNGPIPV